MHILKFAGLSAIALATLAVSSCSNTTVAESDMEFGQLRHAAAYTLSGSAADYEVPSDLTVACKVDMIMPVSFHGISADTLCNEIRQEAFGTSDTMTAVDSFFRHSVSEFGFSATPINLSESATDSLLNSNEALSTYDGFVSVSSRIATMTPRILSIAVSSSSYAPRAAHGMHGTRYFNYDMEQHRNFGLGDLVKAESIGLLPAIIAEKARQMSCVLGQTEISSLPADNNITIDGDMNIVFVYQPYEAASYAQGEIAVPIPAYTIDSMLTDYGKSLLME